MELSWMLSGLCMLAQFLPDAHGLQGTIEGDTSSGQIKIIIIGIDKPKLPILDRPPHDDVTAVCVDLVIVIDVSCSIRMMKRRKALRIAQKLITKMLEDTASEFAVKPQIALILYSKEIEVVVPLGNTLSLEGYLDAIDLLSLRSTGCRTYTHGAFQEIRDTIFHVDQEVPPEADRITATNMIILFTDGLTYRRHHRPEALELATDLKNSGVVINIVQVPHRHGNYESEEFVKLPSTAEHLFNVSSTDIVNGLLDRIVKDAACTQ